MNKKAAFASVFILAAAFCFGAEVTVGVGGDYPTISEAVRASGSGRLIVTLTDSVHTECGIMISGDVLVKGSGRSRSVIQGAETRGLASNRVFRVTETGSLVLCGLTVRYGKVNELPLRGGGIDSEGFLRMEDCTLSDNDAVYGAGLFTRGRTELVNTVVSGNSTLKAPVEIIRSGVGCLGSGGGIKTEVGAELLIENCAFINNYSIKRGGGIFVACESSAEVINTVFTENGCAERGGAICSKGDVVLKHVTVVHNSSLQRGSGFCNMGRASVSASLFAENAYADFANIRAGGIYGGGFLETAADNFCADGSLPGAASGDARLKPAAVNREGLTYIAIGWFSPARNAVDAAESAASDVKTDQRGVGRDSRPDIGAYELRPFR